jgi:hypothetical protein
MKFWNLTALTLTLAMVAGDAMAQFDVKVSANKNTMRHLKVTRTDTPPGFGQIQMVFWIYPDFELDQNGNTPIILGSDYDLNVDAPYIGMDIYFPGPNLDVVSRQIYVLYIKVGDEPRARISSFNVALSTFGRFDGHYQTKGYLGDANLDPDDQLWHDRAMSEELVIQIVREDLDGNVIGTILEGTIPCVSCQP